MDKKREVVALLQDYLNFLPSGNQEAFVSTDGTMGEADMPLTKELFARMDRKSLVGETYMHLEEALQKLKEEHPSMYHTIYYTYMVDGVGHSDVEFQRGKDTYLTDIAKHDIAIEYLTEYLKDKDLYVRRPGKKTGRVNKSEDMKNKHEELIALYVRYREEDGLRHFDALKNAALVCDYNVDHARTVIKNNEPKVKETAHNDPTKLVGWIKNLVKQKIKNDEWSIFDDLVQDGMIAAMVVEGDKTVQQNAARREVENKLDKHRERGYKVKLWGLTIPDDV